MSITFDVMSMGGVFLCTLRMPLTSDLIADYIGNEPVYDYERLNERTKAFIEEKRPSLKYKKYKICL